MKNSFFIATMMSALFFDECSPKNGNDQDKLHY